ncbi:MAG TPA: methyltransferase [Methanoregula sp.]|nr:methyltransferase [Methanoregula sp.]
MIESVAITLLPAGFLAYVFIAAPLLLQKNIDLDGEAPINRAVFYASKYAILGVWGIMALAGFGIGFSPFGVSRLLQLIALGRWGFGFALLYIGRSGMEDSFRIGTPKEETRLRTGGLFGLCRNPMYVGVYATAAASALYTLDPVVILMGVFVVAVHHRIVLAEEKHMRAAFGRDYESYCSRVHRYLPIPSGR